MAIDPTCGMTVDEASALHAERDGQVFCFCKGRAGLFIGKPNVENNHER